MTSGDEDRVSKIFLRACDLESDQREAFLDNACAGDPELRAEVESLLLHDRASSEGLNTGATGEPTQTVSPAESETLPERIGPYKIVEEIGSGGMGVVYLGEQSEPIRRRAAVKVIKAGMDTKHVVARFESERQALALMTHPNIAKVFDAGTTENGLPYFAMEYVPGVSVTEYCDNHRLTTDERLVLFIEICHAVQHAHQKGIIHRDLKPSNVLVSDHEGKRLPKVIDFGVARAISQRLTEKTLYTQHGMLVGTPDYSSPEQADFTTEDIDTRTDVYSLGVVLYELLVGALPFDPRRLRKAGLAEMLRIIKEEEPSKPSTRITTLGDVSAETARRRRADPSGLRRVLRGDLDWITMKAMAKDRVRRYQSPSELAEDIQRHLQHQPVVAGPPGVAYRAGKFIRRHRLGVAAVATIAIALVAGIAGTTLSMVRATRAEGQALKDAETARQTTQFMVGMFEVSDPMFGGTSTGESVTARDVLDRGAERIRRELQGQPLVRAELLAAMGVAYRGLRFLERSEEMLQEAIEIQETVLGPRDPIVLENRLELATTWFHWGWKLPRYRDEIESLWPVAKDVLDPNDTLLAKIHFGLALIQGSQLRNREVKRHYRQAIAIWEENPEQVGSYTGATYSFFAAALIRHDEFDEAESLLRDAHEIVVDAAGPDSPRIVSVLRYSAELDEMRGDLESALQYRRRVVAIDLRSFPDRPSLEDALSLADLLCAVERHDEALVAATQALERVEERPDLTERQFAGAWWVIGREKLHVGETEAGIAELEQTLAKRTHRPDPPFCEEHWGCLYKRACLTALLGDRDEAIRLYKRAADLGMWHYRADFDSPSVGRWVDLKSLRGDPEFEAVVDEIRDRYEEGAFATMGVRGRTFLKDGKVEEGNDLLEQALAEYRPEYESSKEAYKAARYAALLGEHDQALGFLRHAIDLGYPGEEMTSDPDLESLRGDPEFEAIVAQVTRRLDDE